MTKENLTRSLGKENLNEASFLPLVYIHSQLLPLLFSAAAPQHMTS